MKIPSTIVLSFLASARISLAWTSTSGQLATDVDGFIVDRFNRSDVVSFFQNVYSASENDAAVMNWTGNHGTCSAGNTSRTYKDHILRRINYYRALAGVEADIVFDETSLAVHYDEYGDAHRPGATVTMFQAAQEAALLTSRAGTITHTPASTASCYTVSAWNGCRHSSIAFGTNGTNAIDEYMKDYAVGYESFNTEAGHRRWLLAPDEKAMATGDVPAGGSYQASNVLYVLGYFKIYPTPVKFVPWPSAGYFPSPHMMPRWSLSYPYANFSAATVTVTNGSGVPLGVTIKKLETGYGDETIVWDVSGLPASYNADQTYNVTVSNIQGIDVPSSYSYSFTVINPSVASEYLNINPVSKTISAHAQSYTIQVNADKAWKVTENSEWLSVSDLSGLNNGTVTVSVDDNSSSDPRTATILIGEHTHTVTQTGSYVLDTRLAVPNHFLGFENYSNSNWASDFIGTYQGLFVDGNGKAQACLQAAKIAKNGAFSAKCIIQGLPIGLKGNFSAGNLNYKLVIAGITRNLTLRLGKTIDNQPVIAGSISSNDLNASLHASRAVIHSAGIGKWTFAIPADASASSAPAGDGTGKAVAGYKLNIPTMGVLGDGTKFTAITYIGIHGEIPFYAAVNGRGFIAGNLSIREVANTSSMDGLVHWSKPVVGYGPYRAGFSIVRPVLGSKYVDGARIALSGNSPNAVLKIFDLETSTIIQEDIFWNGPNKFLLTNATTNKFAAKCAAATGILTGSFTTPNKFKNNLTGICFQKQNIVTGVVTNPKKQTTGWFTITPK